MLSYLFEELTLAYKCLCWFHFCWVYGAWAARQKYCLSLTHSAPTGWISVKVYIWVVYYIVIFSLEGEKFRIKVAEEIKTHISWQIIFSRNSRPVGINYEKYRRTHRSGKITDNLAPSIVIEFDCDYAVGWWRHFRTQLLIFPRALRVA
jgi:hypothetical protein